MRTQRGASLVDVMLALFLMSMAALVFTACFPSGFKAVKQGGDARRALAIARREMELVRALPYEELSYSNLITRGAIDTADASSPYTFTSVGNLASCLTAASGTLAVTDVSSSVKEVVVTVRWQSGGLEHSTTMKTYVGDKRPAWGS